MLKNKYKRKIPIVEIKIDDIFKISSKHNYLTKDYK